MLGEDIEAISSVVEAISDQPVAGLVVIAGS
jgi:hypothetical protein